MFGRKKDEGGIPGMGSLTGSPLASARPSGIPGSEQPQAEPASTGFAGATQRSPAQAPQLGASSAEPWAIGPWTIRLFVVAFFAAFAVLFYGEEQRRLNDPVERANRGEITATGVTRS